MIDPVEIRLEQTTLAVLAGGEGQRMGQPKAALNLQGQPILEYLLDRFGWSGPTLLVASPGREHPPGYPRFTREVVDAIPGQGPLYGLFTALSNLDTPIMLATTVDMPAIGPPQLHWLLHQIQSRPEALGIMLERRTPEAARIEPFPCIFRASAKSLIADHLASGSRSVHSLTQKKEGISTLTAPAEWAPLVWTNLNSPGDLQSFLAHLQNSSQAVR
jgi:molybdopterin-guanine dinucleotide biosynthesis protein A